MCGPLAEALEGGLDRAARCLSCRRDQHHLAREQGARLRLGPAERRAIEHDQTLWLPGEEVVQQLDRAAAGDEIEQVGLWLAPVGAGRDDRA